MTKEQMVEVKVCPKCKVYNIAQDRKCKKCSGVQVLSPLLKFEHPTLELLASQTFRLDVRI